MAVDVGGAISHYRLVEKIGEGGMGVVWRAVDTSLDREVAIKFLPRTLEDAPERLQRLENEAKTLAALEHPNIITIHSIERDGGVSFLTMELIRGRPLDEVLPEGGLPFEQLMDIAVPMTDAIGVAHEHGITHRDLKPRNIMVRDDGVVKILDFGLARSGGPAAEVISPEESTVTGDVDGTMVGTLRYMAPEQIEGKTADPRSDVFALGILVYLMATGRRPFRGDTPATHIASVLRDRPRRLTQLRPELPRRLERLVERCLEKDPGQRPASAAEVSAELAQIRRRPHEGRSAAIRTIAVLPFADTSPEKDQDYFCEGIAEEIINALTRVEGLRVASRSSSFLFKGATLDSREIADRLGVSTLLEGSVRKYRNRLRITAELINAGDGYHLWSERYDREWKDVFAVQDEIAHSIVEALEVNLSPRERRAIKQVATADPQAFDFYLRGRKYFNQYGRRSIEFAQQMFSRAIDIDPSYARAWAGVADCRAFLYMNVGRREENRRKADDASRRAIELDPDLAEGQTSRGVTLSLLEHFREAEEAFQTALRLDPRLFEAHYYYARECFGQGRHDEAIQHYERAFDLRPEDYQPPLLVAQIYEDLGRTAEAEDARRRGIGAAEQRLERCPDDTRALYMGANGLVGLGETERGLEWAARALEIEPRDPMLLYNLACIYSMAERPEQAIDCLGRALEAGFAHIPWITNDSNLDPLRRHPDFIELMTRLVPEG